MAKRLNRLSVDYTGTSVLFSVLNAKDETVATRSYDSDELPDEITSKVLGYGLNKVLTDRTSEETDKVAKLDKMDEVFAMLVAGEWKKERQIGQIVVSVEVEALAELKGITVPQAQKALGAYDKDKRKAILANEKVQEIAARIRKEREETEAVSLDDLAPAE